MKVPVIEVILNTVTLVIVLVLTLGKYTLFGIELSADGVSLDSTITKCSEANDGVAEWQYEYTYMYEGIEYTGEFFTDRVCAVGDVHEIAVLDKNPGRSYLEKSFYDNSADANMQLILIVTFITIVTISGFGWATNKSAGKVVFDSDYFIKKSIFLFFVMLFTANAGYTLYSNLSIAVHCTDKTVATVESVEENTSNLFWAKDNIVYVTYGMTNNTDETVDQISGKIFTNVDYEKGDTLSIYIEPDNIYRPVPAGFAFTMRSIFYGVIVAIGLFMGLTTILKLYSSCEDLLVATNKSHYITMAIWCIAMLLLSWMYNIM